MKRVYCFHIRPVHKIITLILFVSHKKCEYYLLPSLTSISFMSKQYDYSFVLHATTNVHWLMLCASKWLMTSSATIWWNWWLFCTRERRLHHHHHANAVQSFLWYDTHLLFINIPYMNVWSTKCNTQRI